MIFSIILGALLYGLVQFTWYSPYLLGPVWLRLTKTTEEKVQRALSRSFFSWDSIGQVVVPAFLMSMALHALGLVLARFSVGTFYLVTGGIFVLTTFPKYLQYWKADRGQYQLFWIYDGVFFVSLALLALFVNWAQHTLY